MKKAKPYTRNVVAAAQSKRARGGEQKNPKMSGWRSVVSQLLSNEWGAVEVSISVSQLPGFRPPAIPGAGAAFHTVVAAPFAAYHYTAAHALKSHKVSDGLRWSKNMEWLQHEDVTIGDEGGEVDEGRLKKANREFLWKNLQVLRDS